MQYKKSNMNKVSFIPCFLRLPNKTPPALVIQFDSTAVIIISYYFWSIPEESGPPLAVGSSPKERGNCIDVSGKNVNRSQKKFDA